MKLKIWMFAGLALVAFGSPAFATTFTTASGAVNMFNNPVDASVTLTATAANTVTVTLSNLQSGQIDASQLVTDVLFTLSNVTTPSATITSQTGPEENIAKDGTITAVTPTPSNLGWGVNTESSGAVHLCVIGMDCTGATATPSEGIIGPTPNGNGSIDGNNAHNPFVNQTANFTLNIPGVTTSTTFSNVTFSFGTTEGDNVGGSVCTSGCTTNSPFPAPEPGSLLLLGTGLMGAAGMLRRRRAAR